MIRFDDVSLELSVLDIGFSPPQPTDDGLDDGFTPPDDGSPDSTFQLEDHTGPPEPLYSHRIRQIFADSEDEESGCSPPGSPLYSERIRLIFADSEEDSNSEGEMDSDSEISFDLPRELSTFERVKL